MSYWFFFVRTFSESRDEGRRKLIAAVTLLPLGGTAERPGCRTHSGPARGQSSSGIHRCRRPQLHVQDLLGPIEIARSKAY
jgi:hypothetical protein